METADRPGRATNTSENPDNRRTDGVADQIAVEHRVLRNHASSTQAPHKSTLTNVAKKATQV